MTNPGDEYYGHAVANGEVNFFSVSSLERGDIRSGGCLLKYHKRYVQGLKDVESKSKSAGTALHTELENYYKAGPNAPIMLSATAMKALPYLPERGVDILSEAKLSSPKSPHLYAAGVPLIVKVDLIHDRGTNKGGDDIESTIDPAGTVEVLDFKWKKDGSRTEFLLQPAELVSTIQMSGYGVCIGNVWPDREHVRLSHLYVPATRGNAKKVTRLHVIDDCRRNWEYVESVARTLIDVAKETNERHVPGNRHACDKYGGCDHRANCYAYARNTEQYTTSLLFGQSTATELKDSMSLLTTLPTDLVTNVSTAQPQTTQPSVAQMMAPQPDLRAQLASEETAQRAQATQQTVGTYPGFAAAWATIEAAGSVTGGPGIPGLAGQAAQLKGALNGYAVQPGAGLAGTGHLGQFTISDPAQVIQLAQEIATQSTPAQPAPVIVQHVQHVTAPGFIAPEAPPSNPALSAKPIEGFSLPGMQVAQPAPQVAATVTLQPATPAVVQTTETPKKKARRTKAEMESASTSVAVVPTAPATTEETFDANSAVFVNCLPNSDFESLRPYVDQICDALVKRFNNGPEALRDVRIAPKDSPLGYGGWAGAIRALVIDCPPPPGTYFIDTRDSDLTRAVTDGLETVCNRTGALFTKGI